MSRTLHGLVAAVFTPLDPAGDLDLDRVPAIVDHLIGSGVDGLFVCGSTGEGPSLTLDERDAVATAYIRTAAGRLPVVVHVGDTCLRDAAELAARASRAGADAIAAVPPFYYRPMTLDAVVDSLDTIFSHADGVPAFYYHIPSVTGIEVDVPALLERAVDRLPTLEGVKFSTPDIDQFTRCRRVADGRFTMLFGVDERLLDGLAAGAHGAVGSTYNFAAPIYRGVIEAFGVGDLTAARRHQDMAVRIIEAILRYPAHPALKAAMAILGVDCGPPREPLRPLATAAFEALRTELTAVLSSSGDGAANHPYPSLHR